MPFEFIAEAATIAAAMITNAVAFFIAWALASLPLAIVTGKFLKGRR